MRTVRTVPHRSPRGLRRARTRSTRWRSTHVRGSPAVDRGLHLLRPGRRRMLAPHGIGDHGRRDGLTVTTSTDSTARSRGLSGPSSISTAPSTRMPTTALSNRPVIASMTGRAGEYPMNTDRTRDEYRPARRCAHEHHGEHPAHHRHRRHHRHGRARPRLVRAPSAPTNACSSSRAPRSPNCDRDSTISPRAERGWRVRSPSNVCRPRGAGPGHARTRREPRGTGSRPRRAARLGGPVRLIACPRSDESPRA